MKNLISCFAVLFISTLCYGQNAEKTASISFRGGVMATSTAVYHISGTDTTYKNNFVLAPVLSIVHDKGFAIDYSPYFLTSGAQPGIYMHTLTLGYENYDGQSFTVSTGYTHYFFTGNKSIPYSPITNELYFSTDYKKTWLQPAVSLGYGFGQDQNSQPASEFYMGLGLKHGFDIENADIFSSIDISPSVFLNAGTNKYYSFLTSSKYVSRNKNSAKTASQSGRGRRNGNNNGGSTTGTAASSSFTVSNLEMGLYSDFTIQQVHIKPQGSVFIPVRKNDGGLSGYWQVNLEYYF
jgi:hypothetical protein